MTAAGLFIADKPRGPSSFAVIGRVRHLYGVRQVGHAGTLDPLASGVLPVLVGEATKLVPYLMGLEKEYQATAHLGVATDTYDAEGRVTRRVDGAAVSALGEDEIRAALASFVGQIAQRPPIYSAIKKDGKRLYQLARAQSHEGEGEGEAALVPDEREVVVHEIRLEDITLPEVRFTVRCGKGTYIRSLAHDLGQRLGVGAHLVALRRTRVGPFASTQAVDPFTLGEAPALLPLARAVEHLPLLEVDDDAARRLRLGQQAPLARCAPGPVEGRETDTHRVLRQDGELIALAEWRPGPPGHWSLARVLRG
ncbi:MAG TPA: tRNA pseudouridine(55) synthase TruB [Polyangia bacterium]|jgi:tRNA pseudouridine55 synthase|nr:tRNA pseudouridine(55) synthase TruB [Polyangia bacterium]